MIVWSEAPRPRDQGELLAPSLDDQIEAGAGVRFLDALLREVDWSEWEAQYHQSGPGRPTHHPRIMCGAILYGLMQRMDSTRRLEHATRYHLDFHWLLDGRRIDHTTFAKFRTRHAERIQALFVQINRRAAQLKRLSLEEVVIDGTRLRADSDRSGARSAEALQKRLTALEEKMAAALERLEQARESGDAQELEQAQREKRRLEARQRADRRALEVAQARDEAKQGREGKKAEAVRVPVSDPQSHLLPNKEGGYAPNFTPTLAVDASSQLILASHISETNTETDCIEPLMQEIEQTLQAKPQRVLADQGFGSGPELEQLESQGIEAFIAQGPCAKDNPALRDAPGQPVAQSDWERLPRRKGKLSREAFVYDSEQDLYYCPMGHSLPVARRASRRTRDGKKIELTHYMGAPCERCPLASQCLSRGAKSRMIVRDSYEPLREQIQARMHSPAGREIYARRAPCVEGTFAIIKAAMGVRRFRRRGLQKARIDWTWICLAFNLKKLTAWMSQQHQNNPQGPLEGLLQALKNALALIIRLHNASAHLQLPYTAHSPATLLP